MNTFDKVKEMIANTIQVEENKITMESRLQEDLGADSLDAVELIMNLEEEFNMSFDDDALQKIKTVKDLVDFIENNK